MYTTSCPLRMICKADFGCPGNSNVLISNDWTTHLNICQESHTWRIRVNDRAYFESSSLPLQEHLNSEQCELTSSFSSTCMAHLSTLKPVCLQSAMIISNTAYLLFQTKNYEISTHFGQLILYEKESPLRKLACRYYNFYDLENVSTAAHEVFKCIPFVQGC